MDLEKTYLQIHHKPLSFHGTKILLVESEFISKLGIMVHQGGKGDDVSHIAQHPREEQATWQTSTRWHMNAMQTRLPTVCKETLGRSKRTGQMMLAVVLLQPYTCVANF
jgi:hypothetical protein